jgi:hypothetical protein
LSSFEATASRSTSLEIPFSGFEIPFVLLELRISLGSSVSNAREGEIALNLERITISKIFTRASIILVKKKKRKKKKEKKKKELQ